MTARCLIRVQASKYRPGDKVLLSKAGVNVLDGPYLIEKTVSPGKYTLADEKGHKMNEGKVVGDEDLQRA